MLKDVKLVILHNIISPYKTLLFNELYKICNNLKVLYMAETESIREWHIKKDELKFPYEIMFKGSLNNVSALKVATKTWKRLTALNPDVLIIGGYNYLTCWAAFIWAKIKKKKIVIIIESHYLDKPRTIIKEGIKKLFVSHCDAALVDGTRHKAYTVSLGLKPEKVFIKNGTGPVDVSWYQREILRYKKDKVAFCKKFNIPYKNFLYVGRFSPEKNLLFLLKCFKKLQGEGVKDWGLILVGNGPQRKEIENFIDENNIINVFLPGFRQKEEVPFYYALSDYFILPSTSEPWGLVVNEAMACGLPVLVSNRCGCYPDLVKEGVNGFSFDPYDKSEFYNLMKEIVEGKYDLESMGKASIEIIKDYTPEKAAKIIMDTIIFALNEKE